MVKLSIVITYYNTYELTEELLSVLIPQLNEDVEVFLVDDGCNEKRLDMYDEDIKIIHLEKNMGNSVALNTGIKKATGKYIGVIDSDDLITEDYIETLLKAIDNTDCDLIYLDWIDKHNHQIVKRPSNPAPWRNLYKREIIPLFDENIRHCNDVPFREKLNEDNKSKYYTDKVLYIYNSNRIGSLTWEKEQGDIS